MNAVADKYNVSEIAKFEAVLTGLSESLLEATGRDRLEVEFSFQGRNPTNYRGGGDKIRIILEQGRFFVCYAPSYSTMNHRSFIQCLNNVSIDTKENALPAWLLEELSSEWKLSYVVRCFKSAMKK